MKRSGILTAITAGVLSLIFGVMLAVAMGSSLDHFSPAGIAYALLAVGVLSGIGGIFGIAGGSRIKSNALLAKKLLLVAAICTLPMGFLFFFMFMIARKNASDPWAQPVQ